jgi:hypothetical protein
MSAAVDLIVEPVEVRLLGGAEVSKRFGFEADTLEDGLLVPHPAPHRRDPGTGLELQARAKDEVPPPAGMPGPTT